MFNLNINKIIYQKSLKNIDPPAITFNSIGLEVFLTISPVIVGIKGYNIPLWNPFGDSVLDIQFCLLSLSGSNKISSLESVFSMTFPV